MVLVPTALEVVRGVSVLEAGILFLGFSVPFALGGVLSGFMIRASPHPARSRSARRRWWSGWSRWRSSVPTGPLGSVILTLAVIGLGNGVVYSAATSYALIDSRPTTRPRRRLR